MSKSIKGVFEWPDGKITAMAIRDDMIDHAGVKLLAEVDLSSEGTTWIEAVGLANAWNDERVRFVTKDEYYKLNVSTLTTEFNVIGFFIAKVRFVGHIEYSYYIAK